MAYERNSFRSVCPGGRILGTVVEYDPSRRRDPSGGWRWAVYTVIFVAVLISFVSARGCFRGGKNADSAVEGKSIVSLPVQVQNAPSVGKQVASVKQPEKNKPNPVAAGQASQWARNASGRSARERTLLSRLADAESQGRLAIAVDTIEHLRHIPSMADIDDKLARRLGDLNIKRLFSGEPVPWIREITVRRGQSVHRIAREHGTTVAAVRRLNSLTQSEEPKAGRRLRVLEFPKAAFVVHKQTKYADLTLNGKLFRRYYVSTRPDTKPGAYQITGKPEEGPRSRFAALGILVAPADMRELDMFLAPGSSLTISEM